MLLLAILINRDFKFVRDFINYIEGTSVNKNHIVLFHNCNFLI